MASDAKNMQKNINGLSGLLAVVLAQTGNIQAADASVESKANSLMAAALVIVALLGTQLRDPEGGWRGLSILSMLLVILVVAIVLYATRNRRYRGAVVDLATHIEYFSKDDELLLAQLIEDADQANAHNGKILHDKRRLFRLAISVFVLGFIAGIASLFINY
jgi:hypothetical protein